MPEKYYTAAEANALLPRLRPLLERIKKRQQALIDDKALAAIREKAAQNGGGAPGRELSERARAMERDLTQLQEWGIILRDPLTGLIDFFHQREGKSVFLCWRLGEPMVAWWHPMDTGVAGRQRL
jgi:hypothetical protein